MFGSDMHRIPEAIRQKNLASYGKFRQTLKYDYYILVSSVDVGGKRNVIVYLDLLFLTNLLIDAAVLKMTAWTRKLTVKPWRIAVSAFIGASYAVMMFFPALSFIFTFVVKCIFSIFMIMTAFGFGGLQHFLRNIGTFYLVNFAAAGGIFAVHYFWQSQAEVFNGIWFTRSGGTVFRFNNGLLFTLAVFPFTLLFYRVLFRSAKRKEEIAGYYAQVHIYIDEHESSCTGLIDTGNQLYDPLTRTPVIVMEASQWNEVLPAAWMQLIRQSEADRIVTAIGSDAEPFIWQERLRLVPYRGINNGTQFMLALKPDKVVIVREEKKVETHKVLVGLDGGRLCSDGSYQAIIHPALLEA